MSTSTIVWIVVGVLVVLALVLLAIMMSGKRKLERQRAKAGDIRQDAAENERDLQRHQAEAAEQEALARQARAEADHKAAAAQKLELDAQERAETAAGKEAEQRDRLREADRVDPDVPDPDSSKHADHDNADGDGLVRSPRNEGLLDGAHVRAGDGVDDETQRRDPPDDGARQRDVLDDPRGGPAHGSPPSRPGE